MLSKAALFERLAEGHAARITVVTPNRRLSQTLMAEFDAFQIEKKLSVWEAPDILPFGSFVERLWEEALYCDPGENLPLLPPRRGAAIWRSSRRRAFSRVAAAAQCRDAWRLLHAWRIPSGPGGEDAQAFQQWARKYAARTRGETDSARLPDLVSTIISHIKVPKLLIAYAFDILPPQTKEFLSHFTIEECHPKNDGAHEDASLRRAGSRSRRRMGTRRLEEGRSLIGVVVRSRKRRKDVVRVFARTCNDCNLPVAARARSFQFLARSRSRFSAHQHCAQLIRFSFQELDFARASRRIARRSSRADSRWAPAPSMPAARTLA